jgi:hypothetical protein
VGSQDDNLIEKPSPAVELNPRVPPMLNELIMRCVEIDPRSRPASMHDVAERLELVLGKLRAERSSRDVDPDEFDDETRVVDGRAAAGE